MPRFDRAAIEELFAYTGFTWNGVAGAIRDLSPDNFTRPAPGSGWPSLRDALGHMLFAYDRWLGIMLARPLKGTGASSVETLEDANAAYTDFRIELRALLDGADDAELARVRDFTIDGDVIRYSLGELLAHTLLHEIRHAGDITTLFYQLGVQPDMALEYRFYLGRHGAV